MLVRRNIYYDERFYSDDDYDYLDEVMYSEDKESHAVRNALLGAGALGAAGVGGAKILGKRITKRGLAEIEGLAKPGAEPVLEKSHGIFTRRSTKEARQRAYEEAKKAYDAKKADYEAALEKINKKLKRGEKLQKPFDKGPKRLWEWAKNNKKIAIPVGIAGVGAAGYGAYRYSNRNRNRR